ncbi:Phage tail fibre repeat protein [Sodalis glossinidius str. 'morsitans']|nr:Phage tail fibre repeat protein [Sodalis glossinidius str. 'morsitans']
MAKNEFLPFATADGANVLSAEDYQTLRSRSNGFSAGVARSQELNTVWRQASVIAHVVAQFIADTNNSDVADDGDLDKLQAGLIQALSKNVNNTVPAASLKTAGITQLSSATNSDSETLAAMPKAVKAIVDNLSGGRLLNIQSFTESGIYTPTPGTRKIRVKCWGAGGSGARMSKQSRGSVSGAGGAYAEVLLDATSFSSVSVEVGTGGAASADGVSLDGGDGGGSYFGKHVICGGGKGGLIGKGLAKGGEPAGGNVMMVGGQAGQGGSYTSGILSNGVGGASFGGYNALPHVSLKGDDGSFPGGGGAMGSYVNDDTQYAAGKGGDGFIILEEYS